MDKIGIEQISNGWLIQGTEFKTYREDVQDAVTELKLALDELVKIVKDAETSGK